MRYANCNAQKPLAFESAGIQPFTEDLMKEWAETASKEPREQHSAQLFFVGLVFYFSKFQSPLKQPL